MMANSDFRKKSQKELEIMLTNATRWRENPDERKRADAVRIIEEIDKELFNRKKLERTKMTSSFEWTKPNHYKNRLSYEGEMVAEIILVANHSNENRAVYDAYISGKKLSDPFEYINPARDAVLEEVKKRLARGELVRRNAS